MTRGVQPGPGNPGAGPSGRSRSAIGRAGDRIRYEIAARRPRRRRGDRGSALVEFVGLSVVLLIPLVYLVLSVFSVQRSAFAVTQAAREAGRAFATADSEQQGLTRARLAAALALSDQGVREAPQVRFAPAGAHCGDADPGDGAESLVPGARFVVCVRTVAPLPLTASGMFRGLASVTVNGQFEVVVDAFRAGRN